MIAHEAAHGSDHLAAHLLSQAEHDARASATLLCLSSKESGGTSKKNLIRTAAASRRGIEIAAKSLTDQGAIIIVHNLEQAVDFANRIAPGNILQD